MEEIAKEKSEGFFDKTLSGILNLIFLKDKKIERYVLGLILIGFILRLIAALNLGVFADDMLYASQSAGIINAGVLSTHSNPPLFFYLTNLVYNLLGYTTLASRFWPLIFGTLLIPLSFLLAKKIFNNKKIALATAFFVTFSNFLVRMTFTEASLPILFFSFLGVYLGLEYLDNKKIKFIIFSGISFGLACLIKYSAPFFILGFLIFSLYYVKSKKEIIFSKKHVYHLILFILIILLFCLPFLTFNYLLYKDKGIEDVYFSRFFPSEKTQQLYSSLAGQDTSFFQNLFNINNYHNYNLLYHTDILLLIFGIFGIIFMFYSKNKKELLFFFIFLIIPFILQSAGSNIQKHFVFIPFLFALPAGFFLEKIYSKLKKQSYQMILLILLIIILILSLGFTYGTPHGYLTKSSTSELKSFINNNVKSNDLILIDSRIYTAQAYWLATPNHLVSTQLFPEFYTYNENLTSSKTPTKVWVIDCAIDDCGWGTINSQSDFNKSTEDLLNSVENQSKFVKTISAVDYQTSNEFLSKKNTLNYYNIYSITLNIDPGLLKQSDYFNNFYFTPYLYKNMETYLFDYKINSGFDSLLQMISILIINLSMIFSILAILFIFYFFLNK